MRNKPDILIRILFEKKVEGIDPSQFEPLFTDMPGKPEGTEGTDAPDEAVPAAAVTPFRGADSLRSRVDTHGTPGGRQPGLCLRHPS
jgi:hypothetical protein